MPGTDLVVETAGRWKGADRAVLLAHGAGSDRNGRPLVAVADALAAAGVPSLRFDYPYRTAGKKAPDRAAVLESATRAAAAELARRSKLPPDWLVIGGRSMGGRYCSLAVGAETDPVAALGLLLLGYPLHAAGRPDRPRADHFPRLHVPTLFVSGTRDAMAGKTELTRAAKRIRGAVSLHWLEGADHGYRPLKSTGRTIEDVLDEVAATAVRWVTDL